MALVGGDQPGPDIAVPALDDLEDGHGDNGGLADGNHHLEQVFQVRGAVHLGGVVQFVGNLGEILLQQVDVKHRGHRGQNQAGKGIAQPGIRHGDIIGDDHQLIGNHHQGQKQGKGQILPPEIQPGKGKGRQHRDDKHQGRGNHGKHNGIEEILAQGHGPEGIGIVLQGGTQGEELGDILAVIAAVALHRGQQHPIEGKQHKNAPDCQQGIHAAPAQGFFFHYLLHLIGRTVGADSIRPQGWKIERFVEWKQLPQPPLGFLRG